MQDVLREVDLSAGAVYRYFKGKEELIGAIVGEVLGGIRHAFEEAAEQTPPPPPDVLLPQVMESVLRMGRRLAAGDESAFPRLMVQVWTETLRDEKLSAVMREGYEAVQGAWVRIVVAYQEAGIMRSDVPAEHVARAMIAMAQGLAAQRALFGAPPVSALQNGLKALISMDADSDRWAQGREASTERD
ncbi:Transcriptional regulator, TetR family [Streptomyces sp. YIM 130001]|nr:Transcriptional regulator, TetR family [Streptomyces sp. YIM 130001]